jgi:hypothetical protein
MTLTAVTSGTMTSMHRTTTWRLVVRRRRFPVPPPAVRESTRVRPPDRVRDGISLLASGPAIPGVGSHQEYGGAGGRGRQSGCRSSLVSARSLASGRPVGSGLPAGPVPPRASPAASPSPPGPSAGLANAIADGFRRVEPRPWRRA